MSKYGTPWVLLCLLLAVMLIDSYIDNGRIESNVESLQAQIEELEYQLDDNSDCNYCDAHDYEDFVCCNGCDSHFPREFAFIFDDDPFCPLCVNEELEYALSSESGKCAECGLFYERKWGAGFGLCESCGDKILAECDLCYRYDQTYVVDVGYNACIDCLQDIITDMNLEPYIDAWKER